MKSYNDIAKEVLRRRDERLALAAKKRAAFVKTGSVIACFCVVAISGFFAVNNSYITKSVVDTQPPLNTIDPESGDDPISAYVTDESDTTDKDTESDTTTDPVSSDTQSESDDTTTDPITVIPPDTEPEPPVTDTPGTSEPPSTRPEPPETTDPPTSDTEPPETTPGTSEPPSTKPEPPVTDPPVTEPPVTKPPVTEDTGIFDPPDTDMWPTDTAPEPNDTAPAPPVTEPPYYDPYPPYGDPVYPGLEWEGGYNDMGFASVSSADQVTKADFFYLLYYKNVDVRVESDTVFEDCSVKDWFFEPVYWASQNGILDPVPSNSGEYFNPFSKVSLQDIACYLYALAGSPKTNTSIETYDDFDKVSSYAVTAMTWCVEQGIITDTNNYLSPLSNIYLSELEKMFTAFQAAI